MLRSPGLVYRSHVWWEVTISHWKQLVKSRRDFSMSLRPRKTCMACSSMCFNLHSPVPSLSQPVCEDLSHSLRGGGRSSTSWPLVPTATWFCSQCRESSSLGMMVVTPICQIIRDGSYCPEAFHKKIRFRPSADLPRIIRWYRWINNDYYICQMMT